MAAPGQTKAVTEALESSDPSLIKTIRGSQLGSFTRSLNDLKSSLKKQTDSEELDLAKISDSKVKHLVKQARSAYDNVVNLHERYLLKKTGLTDTESEDNNYIAAVEAKFYELIELQEQYDSQVKEKSKVQSSGVAQDKAESFKGKAESFKDAVADYDSIAVMVEELLASEDKHLTAELHKDLLTNAYEKLSKIGQELLEMAESSSPSISSDNRELYSCSKQRLTYRPMLVKLVKIIKEHEAVSRGVRVNTALNPITTDPLDGTPPSVGAQQCLKLKKLEARHFSGQRREYAAWKRDFLDVVVVPGRPQAEIGFTLKSCIPLKFHYLFDNLSLSEHGKMLEILDNKFGKARLIIDETIAEMERIKPVTNDQDFITFVDKIDKIRRDLSELKMEGEIQNSTVLSKLEQKLPFLVRRDWIVKVSDEAFDAKSPKEIFDEFIKFLKQTKKQVEYDSSDSRSSGFQGKSKNFKSFTMGGAGAKPGQGGIKLDKEPKREAELVPCIACNDGKTNLENCMHKMTECEVFKSMPLKDLLSRVKCKKCPYSNDNHAFQSCKRTTRCYNCKETDHHGLLCAKKRAKNKSKNHVSLAKSNSNFVNDQADVSLPPVMCQVMYVKALSADKKASIALGAVWDSYSTDNYITHKQAKKLELIGRREAILSVEGFNKHVSEIETTLYPVEVVDLFGKVQEVLCYGVDEITTPEDLPDVSGYRSLCSKFGVMPAEVRRPKYIDILFSMRESASHPVKVKSVGNMTLYRNAFGKTFGGWDTELNFKPHIACYKSIAIEIASNSVAKTKTMKALIRNATGHSSKRVDQKFMDYCLEDSIGVHCHPACGGCRCGQCISGNKFMSLKDEKAYAEFANNLRFEEIGTAEDPGPYYVSKFPWAVDRNSLPNNLPAVIGVMNATKRKLQQDPEWEDVYEAQLRTLIDKGWAREVSDSELQGWKDAGNPVYYTAHQMVIQPESLSTPIRVVFNSSQVYQGKSLNGALNLGPDVLNSLHAVLLRFRNDVVAASGDISKMFYMVRIAFEDTMMQLFVWRWKGETKLRTFAMTRCVMGNKPSTNISCVAVKLNAERGNNKEKYPVAHKALTRNSYCDNTFLTAKNHDILESGIEEIERVSNSGGFYYKEWQKSKGNCKDFAAAACCSKDSEASASCRKDSDTATVCCSKDTNGVLLASSPFNDEEEKALGLMWNSTNDILYVKVNIAKKPKKVTRKKIYEVSVDFTMQPLPVDARCSRSTYPLITVKPHLNIRTALSIHMKPYDPLGLVLPTRMIGMLLLRETMQKLKKQIKGPVPWDEEIKGELLKRWLEYFAMLVALNDVKFPRSFKPDNVHPEVLPWLLTFGDGNPDSFGANSYALWTLEDMSKECRLIMSKAKLAPILAKEDTVRCELNGATYAARIDDWITVESDTKFDRHIHFLDSTIVQAMIRKPSYGFNTFAGLRVGEIQQKTNVDSWLHVASEENISDILTRGAPPIMISTGSVWQSGPSWLLKDVSEWPVNQTSLQNSPEIDSKIEEFQLQSVKNKVMSSKSKSLVITKSKSLELNYISSLLDVEALCKRRSNLDSVLLTTAFLLRIIFPSSLLRAPDNLDYSKSETDYKKIPPITASERNDAFNLLIYLAQMNLRNVDRLVPARVVVKLINYPLTFDHMILGGRIKNFPKYFASNPNIPIIPSGSLAQLIIRKYHMKYHRQVDTVVTHVRNEVWIIGARKIASKIDRKCITCIKARKKLAEQVMGDLPEERSSEMYPAWSCVSMDYFGPLEIRDEVIKKGPRVCKKIWGVIWVCMRTRGVHLDIASDYSTESVLHVVRRLKALKGNVGRIVSDRGTNLISASKELKEWRKGWNESDLVKFGAKQGIEWNFVMPASQHQNGSSEVMIRYVKGIKESYMKALGDTKLT